MSWNSVLDTRIFKPPKRDLTYWMNIEKHKMLMKEFNEDEVVKLIEEHKELLEAIGRL